MYETKFIRELFGKNIEVIIYNLDKKQAENIMEEFYREALRLQKIFNFYDKESELSELNRKRKMKVSRGLLEVLKKSLRFSKKTSGEYNPALGEKISLRKNGKDINNDYPNKKIKIRFNKVILPEKAIIDLGSIAKGYITDKLGEFLKSKDVKEFVINSRGDLIFSGDSEHVIGVENPRNSKKDILKIKVKNCGVATSGDYNQFDKTPEKSHIINQKDNISVTVVAPNLEDADVLATVLFVSDKKTIENIMNENKHIKALTIDKNLNKQMYNSFEKLIY